MRASVLAWVIASLQVFMVRAVSAYFNGVKRCVAVMAALLLATGLLTMTTAAQTAPNAPPLPSGSDPVAPPAPFGDPLERPDDADPTAIFGGDGFGGPSGGGITSEASIVAEYIERANVTERLQALGDDLMGDSIDLNTGSVSFQHVDVSLPGNSGLEVAIRRTREPGFVFPHLDAARE